MANFGEELAFLKTQAIALRNIPLTFANDYQPPLEDLPKRIPFFPIQVPPPPTKPSPTSTSKSKSNAASAPLNITIKSTKPAISFALKEIYPSDTIAHIKAQLASQHPRAPQPSDQRLLIKGKVLADTKLLQEYASPASSPLTITLMAKPGSTWTGAEPTPSPTAIVSAEPESFAQPTPTSASLAPKSRGHGRSLSGEASNMPVPSLTLSPTPSPDGTTTGVDLKLAMDLDLQPENPRSLTPKAEAYNQVVIEPAFWVKLLEFLKGEFKTEEDAKTAWEEFFLASKGHLTPHQIALIRDTTGCVAMAGI